ncbi:MAG: IclR family transcriptional regulator [Nocardioides sp.]|uniref:IclR family transcriptional regulator n=1 Tax=Nocardioides sp. TaxID=35761 RepID=UPI0039E688FC
MTIDAIKENEANPTPRRGVADRMTQILDVFLLGDERLLLDDVSRATGLPRSTTFRMLTQLVELRWLEHTGHGYRLGVRARGLSGNDPGELRYAAAPLLNELHLRTGGVAHLSVLEGRAMRYLDKIGGTAAASVPSRVGARIVPDRTVSGRCLLSLMSPEEVDDLLAVADHQPRTSGQLAQLHAELDRIRTRHGLAIDSAEQCVLGITAIAAPVHGPDGVLGAISLAVRDGATDQLAPLVALAARRASQALGAPVPRPPRYDRRRCPRRDPGRPG